MSHAEPILPGMPEPPSTVDTAPERKPFVTIRIEGDFDLTLDDDSQGCIFPGPAPDHWTTEDVVNAIKKGARSSAGLASYWNLEPDVLVDIHRPNATGGWDTETATVWPGR